MVDVSEFGELKIHKSFTEDDNDVVQFFPKGYYFEDRNKNLKQMISLVSDALEERGITRGIVIQNTKRFPTPCFIVFDYDL